MISEIAEGTAMIIMLFEKVPAIWRIQKIKDPDITDEQVKPEHH